MDRKVSLLIVDDDPRILDSFSEVLTGKGYKVSTAASRKEALAKLDEEFFDLLLLDLLLDHKLPESELQGLEILKIARERYPDIAAIIITAYGTVPLASDAFKSGVLDFIEKPVDNRTLLNAVERALRLSALSRENRYLRHQLVAAHGFTDIIGQTPEILKIHEQMRRLAIADVPVLIRGESGTGKELIAKALHYSGMRKNGAFVPVNCAALTTELQESELFGHVKGAFTGADSGKQGLFEIASGGTLFLDGIEGASLETQRKLLRALQESKIRRVGTSVEIPVNVRIIAATRRDLSEYIQSGKFDDGLFHRLSVFTITMPPLRERYGDIPLLVNHFLRKHGPKLGKQITEADQDTLQLLMTYNWPGNVRELENIIQRAMILADSEIITADALPDNLVISKAKNRTDLTSFRFSEAKHRFEKSYVEAQLRRTKGNISKAAKASGMSRNNFKGKMKNHKVSA